ncbi:MAG TPA: MFS transporter, partial [Candidatus Nanopelagicales bacterium]|nr:MFS transporter [Candidatus Nanopelagicales bacterium]
DELGRPTATLPAWQLVRLSLYWLGLPAVMGGITAPLGNRLVAESFVPLSEQGDALFRMTALGAFIAMLVQPTVGTISDYTISRWGRRKPYIVIGSVLDVVFLLGVASSNTVLSIAVFVVLLQVSSNFAQGPFQGYVPDLVPTHQVGIASSLVGLFSVLGQVTGFALAALALALYAIFPSAFFVATMSLGALELATMVSVVFRVDDGRTTRDRGGRSWLAIAREAWGTDILRERSFVFLVGSRFFVLMGANVLVNGAVFFLARSLALDTTAAGIALLGVLGVVTVGNLIAVVPAARISDRVGRKPVIYVACALGAAGLAVVAVAPGVPLALVGAGLFGVGSGSFLAVDWALLTDIIPKAASGRYMGISNVATASSGVAATAVALKIVMDTVSVAVDPGAGPRAAMIVGIACYGIGALLLRPVGEPRATIRAGRGPAAVEAASPA